jgi:predicted hydrolase (HD superfamily)
MTTRNEAWKLLNEFTQSASLLKHALSVEACMLWYADHFGVPPVEREEWGICGLLHDFDYEKYPTAEPPDGHPFKGNQILTELGYDESIKRAIMGHATYTGVPRDSLMAQTLFAVDELSGLVTASVLVRPDKNINNLEAKSVRKKMKDKAFARGCNRDDIELGAKELKIDLEIHIQNVIDAMRPHAETLGLSGVSAA